MGHSRMQGGHSQIDTNACDVNNIRKFNSKVDIQDRVHPKGRKHSDLIVNSKFSRISVINHYTQLNNKPLINGGAIHSDPFVNSNTCFNGGYDTSVSNVCSSIDNINVLTYCTLFQDNQYINIAVYILKVFYTR